MQNWHDPSYLQYGTRRQRQAYQALQSLGVGQILAAYEPILTGTVPLDLDLARSDLDLIGTVLPARQPAFAQLLRPLWAPAKL